MNIEQIKQKMEQEAIGRRYMADCCGVSYGYLINVLNGYYPMTDKLKQKIEGVFRNLEIRDVKEARQPVHTEEVVKNTQSYGKRFTSLEEMADWYKQDHSQEYNKVVQDSREATDLFNTDNVDDIPDLIKNELVSNLTEQRILALFDIANRELNLDEITVGYYRKYGEAKPRRFFMQKLYRMCQNHAQKVEGTGHKGQYRKVV